MCAFLAEGGPTPVFVDLLNRIAVEGGDTEHLISGLVNASVVLADVAAGALNTTANALIAGLMGPYSEAQISGPAPMAETNAGEHGRLPESP